MNVLIVQGHPDPAGGHLCNALGDAYAEGATSGGHAVRRIEVAKEPVECLRSSRAFEDEAPPLYAEYAQDAIRWADQIVMVFPLWMGGMPAYFKAWIEQVFRYGFAFDVKPDGFRRLLKGRKARIVVTMGAPVIFYRLIFGAFGTRMLRRTILGMSGIGPVRQSLVGQVEELDQAAVDRWLQKMREMGANAA